jgi:tetratricopeptide (TPR) repeat protein
LNLLSEQKIEQTLQLMGKTPDTKMTPEVARAVCTRAGSKAYLSGSISNLGSQYVIGINAVNCQSGDSLARQQVTADSKEGVLKALDSATIKLRETLGESLKTIHKMDTPIEEATTPSLEALQAYSLGRKMMLGKADYPAAVPMFERAITLDPRFAMAYASLGTCYLNLGEKNLAEQNTEHSYTLRGQVSEWEKFYIESHYYHFVTGDLEQARQVYELWGQTYPRDSVPPQNLGVIYQSLGQYDKSLTQTQEAVRLAPAAAGPPGNLVETYTRLSRFGDARTTADDAATRKLESAALHFDNYNLGFLQHDSEGMAREGGWAANKPANANVMLYLAAEVAGYSGQADKARGLSREAVQASLRTGEKENAARCQAASALREATYGNVAEARRAANAALELMRGRDEQYLVGLALAMVGETTSAQSLADDLAKRYPRDTIVQFNYLPTLRAQILLGKSMMAPSDAASAKDAARKAVEELQAATPYEFGTPGNSAFTIGGYPVYVRGAAYLQAGQGTEAVTEFQKIVERPGVTLSESIGALAYLGLARGYALSGDAAKAKAAYDNFFQLWKVADAHLPILKAARAEYGKLG